MDGYVDHVRSDGPAAEGDADGDLVRYRREAVAVIDVALSGVLVRLSLVDELLVTRALSADMFCCPFVTPPRNVALAVGRDVHLGSLSAAGARMTSKNSKDRGNLG